MSTLKSVPSVPARGIETPWAGLASWLRLLLAVAVVLLAMFMLGWLSAFIPGARHMAQVIDERDLRATAIYYTDFEEPAEGSAIIHDSLAYPPREGPGNR